jgi:hypothetical protein
MFQWLMNVRKLQQVNLIRRLSLLQVILQKETSVLFHSEMDGSSDFVA